jgi:hypothetical protein
MKNARLTLFGSTPPFLFSEFVDVSKIYLVMDTIEGTRLDKLWPSFSSSQRAGVISTLHDYTSISFAKHPRRHIPGPIAKTAQKCYGISWIFGEKTSWTLQVVQAALQIPPHTVSKFLKR